MTGNECGLQWLPLRYPANVRVLVTATLPGTSYNSTQLHNETVWHHETKFHPRRCSAACDTNDAVDRRDQLPARSGEEKQTDLESNHRRRKVGRLSDLVRTLGCRYLQINQAIAAREYRHA